MRRGRLAAMGINSSSASSNLCFLFARSEKPAQLLSCLLTLMYRQQRLQRLEPLGGCNIVVNRPPWFLLDYPFDFVFRFCGSLFSVFCFRHLYHPSFLVGSCMFCCLIQLSIHNGRMASSNAERSQYGAPAVKDLIGPSWFATCSCHA